MESNAPSNETTQEHAQSEPAMRMLQSFLADTKTVPGRRAFFTYRDLGLEAASNGRIRASHTKSVEGMLESTGWHYHVCDMQFVYIMKGTVVIEFEDGTVATFGAGDAMFMPGGVRHNEIYVSADKESLELSLPGKLGTVNVERPAHLPEKLRPTGRTERT